MRKTWFNNLSVLLSIYAITGLLYAVFSFSLTDPNLVLLQWQVYWDFQQWIWQTFFHNLPLLSIVYLGLLFSFFVLYLRIVTVLQRSSAEYQGSWKQYMLIYGLVIAPLFFSYNALSHDVFNYIFNAKMVVVYQADPHTSVALNYPDDPLLRFMHNTHTSAPYGYGWTALSLLPYLLGLGKFFLTWVAFRFWSILSVVGLYFVLQYGAKIFLGNRLQSHQLALVFLNPLFVLEVVSNMHNDLWMMVPAVAAVALITSLNPTQSAQGKKLLLAGILFVLSVTIKWATLVLLPLLLLLLLEKKFLFGFSGAFASKLPVLKSFPGKLLTMVEQHFYRYIPLIASMLLFLPLLTSRSQQFLPWYLIWVLVWLPFIENRLWRNIVLILSASSMLRYLPWLWTGGFEGGVLSWQKAITWLPVLIYLVWRLFGNKRMGKSWI